MRGIEKGEGYLTILFDADEAGLLAGVVDQVAEILVDSAPGTRQAPTPRDGGAEADPFHQWEQEFAEDEVPTGSLDEDDFLLGHDEVDPVVKRMFPDAYPGDEEASRDFRRYTQAAQREAKVADALLVIGDLNQTDRRNRCFVQSDHLGAWLKTLTNVRLALAVRMGIVDETTADEVAQLPPDDARAWLHEVYSWVGWLQENLIEAL